MQFDFDEEEIEDDGGRPDFSHDQDYKDIGSFYKDFSYKIELYDPLDRDIPKINDQTIKTE